MIAAWAASGMLPSQMWVPPDALGSHRLAAAPGFYKARPGVHTYNAARSPGHLAGTRAQRGHETYIAIQGRTMLSNVETRW
jgi:hypothetical protein